MTQVIKNLVVWLKQWFYDKDQIDEMLGGSTSVTAVGQFSINNNGHLIVQLPTGMDNPYSINSNGHLIYDTSV